MAVTRFSAAPGNYGENYISASLSTVGTLTLTSAGVVRLPFATPADRLWFKGAALGFSGVVPIGTVGLNVTIKKRQVGGTFVAISNTLNALGRALYEQLVFTPLAGIAEGSFLLQAGEWFVVEFDNTGGTITTQPQGTQVAAKLAILR